MTKKIYLLALIECESEKFDVKSGARLKNAMTELKASTEGKGQTEIYFVSNENGFVKFRNEIKKGATHV